MSNNLWVVSIAGLSLILPALASNRSDDSGRIQKVTQVFQEIMRTPDQGIPQELLETAKCVCHHSRRGDGRLHIWWQLWQRTGDLPHCAWLECSDGSCCRWRERRLPDRRLFHRRGDAIYERALQSMLNDKFKMGADASVAAGPVGRNAAAGTDAKLNAEILSYSRRIRGLLPGQLGWRRRAGRLERRLRACMALASAGKS